MVLLLVKTLRWALMAFLLEKHNAVGLIWMESVGEGQVWTIWQDRVRGILSYGESTRGELI